MFFHPGPPYFFRCRACGHAFKRRYKLGPPCPKCWSLRVSRNPFVLK